MTNRCFCLHLQTKLRNTDADGENRCQIISHNPLPKISIDLLSYGRPYIDLYPPRLFRKMIRSLLSVALAAVALSMVFSTTTVEASTSPLPLQRLSSEGTFVRGMMSADHQFGLYMTVAETSRGGASEEEDDESRNSSHGNNDPMMQVHHAVDQARDAAVNFADVVRKRAFSPMKSVQNRHAGRD